MTTIRNVAALLLFIAPASAHAQTPSPANTLAQALATLGAADVNKDGQLSPGEVAGLGLARGEFASADSDGDGLLSRDEFLVFYRQSLLAANKTAAPDLEAEVARIQALRKAKAAEDGRVRRGAGDDPANRPVLSRSRIVAGEQARLPVNAEPASSSVEGRLLAALDALERRANVAGASKEDYQRVRDLLIERAREADMAAKGSDLDAGVQSDAHRKLMQSLERIEKRASEGTWSKEEYQTLRDSVIRRARNIASGPGGALSNPPVMVTPSRESLSLEPALQASLDSLEKRAAAGQASAADYQAVRDQLAVRARAQAHGASVGDQQAASDTYAKLVQSLGRLERFTAQGGYSKGEFDALRQSFVKRARNIDDASTSAGSTTASNAGVSSSSIGATGANQADVAGIEKGLVDALDLLEKRAAAGGATREDWQRVRDQLSARARTAVAGLAPAEAQTQGETYRKLEQSLERLEKRANDGGYSKEEFEALRQAFTKRARNISSESQTSLDGVSSTRLDGSKARVERASGAREAAPKGNETPPAPVTEPKPERPTPAPVSEPKPERPVPAPAPVSDPKPERPAPVPPAPPAPVERPKPERPPHLS